MPSFKKPIQKAQRKIWFWFFTFLPGIRHVQKIVRQTVGNKEFDVLLEKLLQHSVKEVTAKQVSEMDNLLLLDARKQTEYEVSHLPNAQWAGYSEFDMEKLIDIDKQQPIIVYCSVGFRSEKIAEQLQANGYNNVANLYGGIFEWVNNGYAVVNKNGVTEKVHSFNKDWGKWLLKGEKVY